MEETDCIAASEFKAGRSMMGRLPWGKDLIGAIEDFCTEHSIKTAVFSIIGSVRSATLGCFDHNQQVHVTSKREEALEIVHCTGNVSLKNGKPTVHAHGVFAGINGQTVGGHIFSETVVYAAEIYIQELLGESLTREYDEQTGLLLWKF